MARPKKAVPAYRKHRATGLAVVTTAERDHYLGPHGTRESREQYARLIAEQSVAESPPTTAPPKPVTVRTLVARFWKAMDRDGRYMKNGVETTERG